jgi:hypothetical protein
VNIKSLIIADVLPSPKIDLSCLEASGNDTHSLTALTIFWLFVSVSIFQFQFRHLLFLSIQYFSELLYMGQIVNKPPVELHPNQLLSSSRSVMIILSYRT